MTCRDCKYLDVSLDKSGKRVPRKQSIYRCSFEPLFVVPMAIEVRLNRRYMSPDDGKECPCYHRIDALKKVAGGAI